MPREVCRNEADFKTMITEVNNKFKENTSNNFLAFHNYRSLHSQETHAQSVKLGNLTLILNSKEDTYFDETQFEGSSEKVFTG